MINIDQRIGDPSTLNSIIMEEAIRDMRCAVPAIIDSFDPVTQTVECQIVVREKLLNKNTGESEYVEISKLVDVPIVLPQVKDYMLTLPIKSGDCCLVVFSDMCYNSWFASGETGNQEEIRRHDLSDGIAIIGMFAQPNVIKNYNVETAQFRNAEGDTYVEINKQIVNVIAKQDVNVKAEKDVIVTAGNDILAKATNYIDARAGNIYASARVINATASVNASITAPNVKIDGTTTINGETTINGNVKINGDLSVSNNLIVSGDTRVSKLYINGKDFDAHTHGFSWSGESGFGSTSAPQ